MPQLGSGDSTQWHPGRGCRESRRPSPSTYKLVDLRPRGCYRQSSYSKARWAVAGLGDLGDAGVEKSQSQCVERQARDRRQSPHQTQGGSLSGATTRAWAAASRTVRGGRPCMPLEASPWRSPSAHFATALRYRRTVDLRVDTEGLRLPGYGQLMGSAPAFCLMSLPCYLGVSM